MHRLCLLLLLVVSAGGCRKEPEYSGTLWVQEIKAKFAPSVCDDTDYFRTCFGTSRRQCLNSVEAVVDACLTRHARFTRAIKTADDSKQVGIIFGGCVEFEMFRHFDANKKWGEGSHNCARATADAAGLLDVGRLETWYTSSPVACPFLAKFPTRPEIQTPGLFGPHGYKYRSAGRGWTIRVDCTELTDAPTTRPDMLKRVLKGVSTSHTVVELEARDLGDIMGVQWAGMSAGGRYIDSWVLFHREYMYVVAVVRNGELGPEVVDFMFDSFRLGDGTR